MHRYLFAVALPVALWPSTSLGAEDPGYILTAAEFREAAAVAEIACPRGVEGGLASIDALPIPKKERTVVMVICNAYMRGIVAGMKEARKYMPQH